MNNLKAWLNDQIYIKRVKRIFVKSENILANRSHKNYCEMKYKFLVYLKYLNLLCLILVLNNCSYVQCDFFGSIIHKMNNAKFDIPKQIKTVGQATKDVLLGTSFATTIYAYDKFCKFKYPNFTNK